MYEKGAEKREWAKAQMTSLDYHQSIKTAVERLLEVWWTQNHNPDSAAKTIEAFSRLAVGHALVDNGPNERWLQVKPGGITRGDTVRVRHDAYSGEVGQAHNGRRGRVIGIRHGDIILRYTDDKVPAGEGVHHSPYALEKLV